MGYANAFDSINKENEIKESKLVKPTKEFLPVAYQIYRVVKKIKMGVPVHQREIIDTIMVEQGAFERAKSRAVGKARMIGKCAVIELCERSVIAFDEADETQSTDDFEE